MTIAFTLILFYCANLVIAALVGRHFFDRIDAVTLVFGTVLRNLSISIGLAAAAFGPNAALMVALAFVIQSQIGAWFMRLDQRLDLFPLGTAVARSSQGRGWGRSSS